MPARTSAVTAVASDRRRIGSGERFIGNPIEVGRREKYRGQCIPVPIPASTHTRFARIATARRQPLCSARDAVLRSVSTTFLESAEHDPYQRRRGGTDLRRNHRHRRRPSRPGAGRLPFPRNRHPFRPRKRPAPLRRRIAPGSAATHRHGHRSDPNRPTAPIRSRRAASDSSTATIATRATRR